MHLREHIQHHENQLESTGKNGIGNDPELTLAGEVETVEDSEELSAGCDVRSYNNTVRLRAYNKS